MLGVSLGCPSAKNNRVASSDFLTLTLLEISTTLWVPDEVTLKNLTKQGPQKYPFTDPSPFGWVGINEASFLFPDINTSLHYKTE